MRRRVLTGGAVALALVLGAGLAPASAATPDLSGKQYVALGDSYSAGFGLIPYSDLPAPGCYQADENYPHLVAAAYGLALDDRTCSGATTLNITTTPQTTITGAGTAPVQADALSASTDLVTITIGGNDLGFADVAETCIAESANGPLLFDLIGVDLPNCKSFYAPAPGVDLLIDELEDTVVPRLNATFADIVSRAPNARVIAIGYPTIAPGADLYPSGCYSSPLGTGPDGLLPPFPTDTFPFTAIDTVYLHDIEARLDDAIRTAAEAHGVTFVSTWALTREHSACEPAGTAYIAGLTLTNDATPANSNPIGDTGYGVLLGALHPNAAGVAFLSDQVIAAIAAAFDDPSLGAPDAPGAPPAEPAEQARLLAEGGAPDPWVGSAVGVAALLIGAGLVWSRGRRLRSQGRGPRVSG